MENVLLFFLMYTGICTGQEHFSTRQVVIGGQIAANTHKENDPLKLLATSTQPKSALHHRAGYKELLIESLCSHSEPLGLDIGVSCATCLLGTCMTHTTFPQTSLLCNLSSNCLISCLLLSYWINDTPPEFTTGILVKKTKSDLNNYFCLGTKKHE